jgi:hypothetical protein
MPGAHHFIRIGFLIFLFQERVFGELAYHVFQHFLADVLAGTFLSFGIALLCGLMATK